MSKYRFELKLEIVKAYISGEGGVRYLAKKYGIKSKSNVKDWVNAYREFGEEGLHVKRKKEKYAVQRKQEAVELYLSSEMSIREVANQIGINSPPLVSTWISKYRENGIDGLTGVRGRPLMKEVKIPAPKTKKSHLQ